MKLAHLTSFGLAAGLLVIAFIVGSRASGSISSQMMNAPQSSATCESGSSSLSERTIREANEQQSCTKDSPNFCGFVPIGGKVCGKNGNGPYGTKEECEREEGKSCRALCASACPAC